MSEKYHVSYFRPGQILFLVEGHPSNDVSQGLIDWANTFTPGGVKISKPDPSLQFPLPIEANLDLKLAASYPGNIVDIEGPFRLPPREEIPAIFTLLSAEVT